MKKEKRSPNGYFISTIQKLRSLKHQQQLLLLKVLPIYFVDYVAILFKEEESLEIIRVFEEYLLIHAMLQ